MFDKYEKYKVISNNKILEGQIDCLEFVKGDALSVLEKARDYIHQGWALLNHPLYGNFTPRQQPYRTILLGLRVSKEHKPFNVDLESLGLIEKSILKFRSGMPEGSKNPPRVESVAEDYAILDLYLVSVNLNRYGIKYDFSKAISNGINTGW